MDYINYVLNYNGINGYDGILMGLLKWIFPEIWFVWKWGTPEPNSE
jgi:hypothetical protein